MSARRFPAQPLLIALTVWVGLQAGTGWLLASYFRPTPAQARASLYEMQYLVRGGALVRALHHHGGSIVVVATLSYLVAVLWRGGYARRWRAGWWSALGAAGALLGLGFTGYLLPWDNTAYWRLRVGTELFGLLPVIGPGLVTLLRGGSAYGAATLQRMFVLHVMLLPVAAATGLVWHWHATRGARPTDEGEQ